MQASASEVAPETVPYFAALHERHFEADASMK
jgi:hypothetical protein